MKKILEKTSFKKEENKMIYTYKTLLCVVIITLIMGCSSVIDDISGKAESSITDNPASFQDIDSDSEQFKEKEVIQELEVSKNKETLFEIENSVDIKIPKGTFTEDSDLKIIHGIDYTNLGENVDGISNADLFAKAPELILDVFEISGDLTKMSGSINIAFDTNDQLINMMNQSLQKQLPQFEGFTAEEDLGIFFFDKKRGKYIFVQSNFNSMTKKISYNTQVAGIYAIGIKLESFEKLREHIFFKNSDNVGGSFSKSIDFDDGAKPYPTMDSSNGIFSGYASPCSSVGADLDWLFKGKFHQPCYKHDWCYRYGYGTYGYSRMICDLELLANSVRKCWNPYNPWLCKTVYYWWKKKKRICIPNVLYIAYKTGIGALCTWTAEAMYLGVVAGGSGAYEKKLSGCYDYKNKGVKCPAVKVSSFKSLPQKQSYHPGETIQFKAEVISNNPKGVTKYKPDRIEWNVKPDIGTLTIDGVVTNTSNDKKTLVWSVPEITPPGYYKVTAKLIKDEKLVYEKSFDVNIVTENTTTVSNIEYGDNYPDYIENAVVNKDEEIYYSYSKGGNRHFKSGVRQDCWREKEHSWCFFKCDYVTKCKDVDIYSDEPVRNYYIKKVDSDYDELWSIPFENNRVIDIWLDNDDLIYAIVEGNELLAINEDGEIEKRVDIGLLNYLPEKVIQKNNNFYILYKNNESLEYVVKVYDKEGESVDNLEILYDEGVIITDIQMDKSALYLTGYKENETIFIAKYDLGLVEQWKYENSDFKNGAKSGKLSLGSAGAVYSVIETDKSVFNKDESGVVQSILNLDAFGNKIYHSVLPGSVAPNTLSSSNYFLPTKVVKPSVLIKKREIDGVENDQVSVISSLETTGQTAVGVFAFNSKGVLQYIKGVVGNNMLYPYDILTPTLYEDGGAITIFGSTKSNNPNGYFLKFKDL